jgi:carbon monoxide dehydrogenase subunit G
MASVHREVRIERPVAAVWDALADVGALHTRLVPGFVTDCRLEPGARVVTFANGMVARELIVSVDPLARRVAWAVVGGRLRHHNASAQALPEGDAACRVVWIADFLPDEFAASLATMIEAGLAAMKKALELG